MLFVSGKELLARLHSQRAHMKIIDNKTMGLRGTAEYAVAKSLIAEKDILQARLREINKRLRQLEMVAAGIGLLVRDDQGRGVDETVSEKLA
ncbi:hypothetical protein BH11PSE11_BH11PSE11_27770 [soil metagenome]